MKKTNRIHFVVAAGVLFIGIVTGCATARVNHVSGDEFIKKADMVRVVGSVENTRFVGLNGSMVILEEKHPSFLGGGVVNTMYWTGRDELPTNIVALLQAGTPPWTNWTDRSASARDFWK